MSVLAVSVEERSSVPPASVFNSFATGEDAGWLFGAVCDHLRVGAPISMSIPIAGGHPVDILGQVTKVRRPSLIEIVHDQPWRGRIVLRFAEAGGGTRIRLQVELDERGLDWLMRRRGFPVSVGRADGPRVGLLTCKSGPGGSFAMGSEPVGRLAIDEINAEGGVGGKLVEVLVADDATDPATGVVEAWRLVRAGCQTIFLNVTSATFAHVSDALADARVLLVFPQMNEGPKARDLRICLGERPAQQLSYAAGPMMRAAGGQRWFCAGNDYAWPRRVDALARRLLPIAGGELIGTLFAPLGTSDFAEIIDGISKSGADIVLNTFVGADATAFERQFYAAGLRNRMRTLAPALDDATLERIGAPASDGIYGVSGYFHHLETDSNSALLRRYREAVGPWAPPLSTLSESVYEAMIIWARAARMVGSTDPYDLARAMCFGRFDLPRGVVELDGSNHPIQKLHLAEARAGRYVVED